VFRRVEHAMGLLQPSHPRGYDDYEARRPADYRFDFPPLPPPASAPPAVDLGDRPFPAIDRLAAELDAAPCTPLLVVFPPVYTAVLPADAHSLAMLAECKARLARLAAKTPGGGFLDYFFDSPTARDQASFRDIDHYRAPVARRIEQEIAGILNGPAAAKR
jgi:hypothetical protein